MKVNPNLVKSFDRVASRYDRANVIPMEVGDRLLERLQIFNLKPHVIVDLGSGTGNFLAPLYKKFRGKHIIGVDISLNMLKKARKKIPWYYRKTLVCATADVLPFASNSVDVIFSNLVFHWCADLSILFAELFRIIRPGGLLMFTMYGPDTLFELRQTWLKVDSYSHINTQPDLHTVGDLLLSAGFADPVLDQEKITLQYNDVSLILSDLKSLGSYNLTKNRCPGLWGKTKMERLIDGYQSFQLTNGKFPVSYEIIYGQAWKSDSIAKHRETRNDVHIPISQIKGQRIKH